MSNNQEVATLFKEVAAAYIIKDEKKYHFQIIAYQKASDTIENLSVEIEELYKENKLDKVPGVGKSIRGHLEELFATGSVAHLETIKNEISPAVFPLLSIPSFGPKKAFKIVNSFSLKDPKTVLMDVEKLAKSGRIAALESFGEKSEADIIQSLKEHREGGTSKSNRMVLSIAGEISDKLVNYLKEDNNVIDVHPLGSLRRRKSTIGDIDIAVSSNNPSLVIEHFIGYPHKVRLIEKGEITSSLLISGNRQIDLMVLPPDQFGSLIQHFTGSKHHNIALREYALKKGFSLSEKGIKLKNGKVKKFRTEREFYNFLDLDWIPPELRENTGEIEDASKHKLPELVHIKDIKGDLHVHSNYPISSSHDYGTSSMKKMLKKANDLNYEYIGFSEHNPSMKNNSSDEIYSILKKRNAVIDQLRKSNKSVRIINLLEVDILANGKLALDDRSLDLLDGAIVSIHSQLRSERKKITDRILSGLSHPKARILAHPTGRLLNQRPGYEVDWDRLFEFCISHNKALEINAWPTRLDLPDSIVKDARYQGIKFVVSTDSHAVEHMNQMPFGVSVARRGWCKKEDILNTLSYSKFYAWLKS